MSRPLRTRSEGLATPEGPCPRHATPGVYASGAGSASAGPDPRDLAIECPESDPEWGDPGRWSDWTDAYRYAITRAWPDSPAGGAR